MAEAWKPKPKKTVSEWADEFFVMSEGSSGDPGKWRTQPQQRAILDAFNEPRIQNIVVQKSSRTGYTKMLDIIIGYCMHWDPCSVVAVQPTEDDAKDWSRDELAPMLEDVPALRGLVVDGSGRRESANTLQRKEYPGGAIDIVGANSPGSFRRLTKRVALFDEVDGYPKSAGKEGDQIRLGRRRTQDFADRKHVIGSSPTIAGASKIEAEMDGASRGYCMVPCPHCGEFHVRKFFPHPNGIECGDKLLPVAHVHWPGDDTGEAAWVCPECSALIGYEHHRDQMDACYWQGADWLWTKEGGFVFSPGFKRTIGFYIWAGYTYSPNTTPPHLAEEFVDSKSAPETLQTFINTLAGETWAVRGEAPPAEIVQNLRRPYAAGEVPDEAIALTCGVDVQKNRFEYAVRAWGRGQTSWLIEEGEIYGDTATPEAYTGLAGLLAETWSGRSIKVMLIDSGYRSPQVYAFARQHPNVRATKGHDGLSKPFYAAKVDVTVGGKLRKGGMQLWHIDTSYFKAWVHGRIEWPPDQPGAWLLHEDTSDDYCRQIVNESLVVHPSGKTTWIVHGDNHKLDAEALNAAAAQMLQVHRMPVEGPAQPTRRHAGRRVVSVR